MVQSDNETELQMAGNMGGGAGRPQWDVINGGAAFVASVVTILAFLIDQPTVGFIGAALLLVAGTFWVFTLVGRRSARAAAIASLLLAVAAFAAGTLAPPYVRPVQLGSPSKRIESIPLRVSVYQGIVDGKQGTGQVAVGTREVEGMMETSYQLDYQLPSSGSGDVELILHLAEPFDITPYRALKMNIIFSDPNARCQLYFKDNSGVADPVMLGDGSVVSATAARQPVRIVFDEHLKFIARTQLRDIICAATTDFVTGNHSVTLSGITFQP
jgi:hypothetical protein